MGWIGLDFKLNLKLSPFTVPFSPVSHNYRQKQRTTIEQL